MKVYMPQGVYCKTPSETNPNCSGTGSTPYYPNIAGILHSFVIGFVMICDLAKSISDLSKTRKMGLRSKDYVG
jgi:hypothetical protein